MQIQAVTDQSFSQYGRVLTDYDTDRLTEAMLKTPLPDDVVYVAAEQALEALPVSQAFCRRGYGGLPVQVGYCNGHNNKLNALEYHRDSEINVAVTDLILILGRQQDIGADFTYDTAMTEAFLVPAGIVIEVYATTLHYAPCGVDGNGFRCVVVLPRGTNTELDFAAGDSGEERLITARNKWLIAHPDAGIAGAFAGLKGENITL